MKICYFSCSSIYGGVEKIVVDSLNEISKKHECALIVPNGCRYKDKLSSNVNGTNLGSCLIRYLTPGVQSGQVATRHSPTKRYSITFPFTNASIIGNNSFALSLFIIINILNILVEYCLLHFPNNPYPSCP